jgi:hypothetical protein
MSDEEKEKVLDLLCDKFVYGLTDEEATELDRLGYDPAEADSIEMTVAALALVDLDGEAPMPASLRARLAGDADTFFGAEKEEAATHREIVPDRGSGRPWFGWLGWAVAGAACIALAVSLFIPRGTEQRAGQPTPTPEQRLSPAQERQQLMASSPELIRAEWAPGKMENIDVSGDVVWSDAKQAGYMRLKGLPKNDPAKETYQLWIVEEARDRKHPWTAASSTSPRRVR